MAYCYNRDFMFCDVCGSQLLLNSPKYATCPNSLCNFKKSSKRERNISEFISFKCWIINDRDFNLFCFFVLCVLFSNFHQILSILIDLLYSCMIFSLTSVNVFCTLVTSLNGSVCDFNL